MDAMLTETGDHYDNPTGVAFELVASGIAITPVDPLGLAEAQSYPLDKLFMARQLFTRYAAFAAGDRLVVGSVTYVVKAVHAWGAQGGLDAYHQVVVEEQL